MRVLLVIDNPDDRDCGKLASDICRAGSRFGLEVSVAAFDAGEMEEEFEIGAKSFHRLESENPLDMNSAYRLRNIVRSRDIDIVHSFGIREAVQTRLATIGNKSVQRVLHLQDQNYTNPKRKGRFGIRSATRMADATLLPTKTAFSMLRSSGIDTRKNFYLCPPGTRQVTERRFELKKKLGLTEQNALIGTKADFRHDSGTDPKTICRALSRVFEDIPSARFVFAGSIVEEGEDLFQECVDLCDESGIGERVFFITDGEEIALAIDSLDLFVCSETFERIPLPLIESMAAGIPSVVSDTETIAELTNGGKCCDVFVRGDQEELANKLLSLIKNEKLRAKRSADARAFAQENFSIGSHLMSLKTLYTELLAERELPTENDEEGSEIDESTEAGDSVLGLE
ncbi:MAG: glycosyltransferase [Acidobacteria bacterium]|nr:MAG: glycosyltransferase [Acidobacteriota bacterium]REJ98353.1 MAG: glycosyltransferase [Acidobacteriota bacterium]REK17097.1 MAG: glycosyltransferase [Acidobacteriota bacterium]REK43007.1 MAG: glycosyltransferase [Acidobacteriota bacterium]